MTEDPAHRVADALERRGLGTPARLLADAHRPLAPLLADLGAALGPLAGALGGRWGATTVELLEDPDALGRIVERLDARRPDAEPG